MENDSFETKGYNLQSLLFNTGQNHHWESRLNDPNAVSLNSHYFVF